MNDVHSPNDRTDPDTAGKPFEDDINDLNPSSDLFASLQVPPQVASGSMSPTEAFLMSFPVVSGSIGKVNEQVDPLIPVSETMTNSVLVNIFSPREEYSPIYSNKNNTVTAMNSQPNHYESQQKYIDGGGQFPSNAMGHSLMDMHFDGVAAFTFTLTTGTTTTPTSTNGQYAAIPEKNSLQAINPVRRSSTNMKVDYPDNYTSSLSTDTKTTNSWSYNNKKSSSQTDMNDALVDSQQGDNGNPQPFSFSLTSSTGSEPKGITSSAKASLGLVSNGVTMGYNASFNSFLAPPPAQLGADCSHYGTNAFSFQLTTSPSIQPAYNTPMAGLGSDLTTANPFATPVIALNTKRVANRAAATGQMKATEPVKREKMAARKSSGQEKKNANLATNKSHVNWMTDSTKNISTPVDVNVMDNYSVLPVSQSAANSYLPVVTSAGSGLFGSTHVNSAVPFRDDFTQKSDIFFAHPAGDERFLWNQPPIEMDRSLRHVDFNVPQLLPPPPPPPPQKTDLVALAPSIMPIASLSQTEASTKQLLKNRISGSDYQPNGNYFSVSNLVAPNKKPPNSMQCSTISANNWKSTNGAWDMEYCGQQKIVTSSHRSPVSSKNYTAEALIGHSPSTYLGSMETLKSNKKSKAANVYSVQNCTAPMVISGDCVDASEGLDFNCVSSGNPFQFFPNDFIQPPAIFPAPPTLPLLPETIPGSVSKKNGTPIKGSSKTPGTKRKSHYDGGSGGTGGSFIFQANDPVSHPTNYDLSSSSSFFSTPQHPPPPPHFLMNSCSDSFNFSDNCKITQPFVAPPPIEFNAPLSSSGSSNYSTNYLPNFNLSSICPEINNVNTIN